MQFYFKYFCENSFKNSIALFLHQVVKFHCAQLGCFTSTFYFRHIRNYFHLSINLHMHHYRLVIFLIVCFISIICTKWYLLDFYSSAANLQKHAIMLYLICWYSKLFVFIVALDRSARHYFNFKSQAGECIDQNLTVGEDHVNPCWKTGDGHLICAPKVRFLLLLLCLLN